MKTLKHTFLAAVAYGKRLPAKKLRSGLLVVAAFAGLAGLIALTDPPKSGAAASAGPGVTVLNTPLPISPTGTQTVAGTVNVGNFPGTQAVTVGNTPNVNVANMPTVSLAPGATFRDADNAARQPVEHFFHCQIFSPFLSCSEASPYTVPSGKELAIESLTARIVLPTTQKVTLLSAVTEVGGIPTTFFGGPSYQADDGTTAYFLATQQVRFYADPSTTVSFNCARNNSNGIGDFEGAFSGYLVDVP